MGRTRLRRFSAAPTNSRRGGDTAPSYDSSVRRRTPRVHRNRRGTRTVVEGRASIVTSPGGTARPGSGSPLLLETVRFHDDDFRLRQRIYECAVALMPVLQVRAVAARVHYGVDRGLRGDVIGKQGRFFG